MDAPRRKSVAQLFTPTTSLPPEPSSPVKRKLMMEGLTDMIRRNWTSSSSEETMSLTIRADTVYRTYATDQDPKVLFEKAVRFRDIVHGTEKTHAQEEVLVREINEGIVHAIFGSNKIERAGLGLDITFNLCQKILKGEAVPDIDERTPEYQLALMDLIKKDSSLKNMPNSYILRGRQEIVQHVRAFQHILHHFVTLKEDLTEDLIRQTHAILCKGVSIIDADHPEVPSEAYAGRYRQVPVGAGSTMFIVSKFILQKMTEMYQNLREELAKGEANNTLDPFSLAAKYSLRFVEIHPFQDGNGIMCRMILNAILFRYVGIVIPIGEREEERDEYMDIKKRVSRDMEGHGEYATFILKKSMRAMQKLKQKIHGKKN